MALRRAFLLALACVIALTGAIATPASLARAATPEYEITGSWIDAPQTIGRGNPVVAEWRVNLNDAENPPSNDPVDNVVATFTVQHALFDEIPDMCLTDGVDPVSALSDDGGTLTCNFGTQRLGTAIVLQTPVVADGTTGDEVSAIGEIDGHQAELPKIPMVNPFVLDLQFGQNNSYDNWNSATTAVTLSVQWSLRLGKGSDPGPDRLTHRVRVVDSAGRPVGVGTHPGTGVIGCSPYDGQGVSDTHPYSHSSGRPTSTRFVETCTLTPVAGNPGFFDLVLDGIDYSLSDLPTRSSSGTPLPTDWSYVASGQLWFRVATSQAGSISLTATAPTYTAPTGQTFTDPAGNNTTSKTYRLPGGWSAAWQRHYTGSGGTPWDDTYRQPAGAKVQQASANAYYGDGASANSAYGSCLALDTKYVTLQSTDDVVLIAADYVNPPVDTDVPIQYYIGGSPLLVPGSGQYNPDAFDCAGPTGWTATPPADLSTVRAVRAIYPFSTFARYGAALLRLDAATTINPNVARGQDVWMFGSVLRQGTWIGPGAGWQSTPTPDARYPNTNGRRDILRVITATPTIAKAAATSTVTPGVPADFTLTYAATGSDTLPDTVDGYMIRDVLPQGMTYVAGSASPEPQVTVNPTGRQVLTWTLDGVATNVEHTLAYQAVADASVAPGTPLTNTAVSSLAGVDSTPATETVTTTTNGYTVILKTADMAYIPNDNGDGTGTGSWTVRIDSHDPIAQAFTDTIDILPHNGDGRGTDFNGTYTLDEVGLPDGGTVYYTDADPATLSDDPADASNGAAGNVDGNTVGWTTTRPENPTAIRVIGGELASGGSFSYQVVITTEGAEPQDVYVNRAQARAEHTALVMRTSAALVVTDFTVVKASDPASGSTVRPGDTITYTITVSQVGSVPAGAWLTDDLTAVLDDATYNGDVRADTGSVTVDGTQLSWEGELPVGGTATITYSVTVKDRAGLEADGDTTMTNVVTSPGCQLPADCTTTHQTGYFDYSKTSVAEPGSVVQVGETITYTVLIKQVGAGEVPGVVINDDLSAVLDDATWNDDAVASAGALSFEGSTLTWQGDLAVGDEVTLTYTVTVTEAGEGDDELSNIVTSPDERGACVPAPDQNPDCRTNHEVGDYEVVKTSDPVTGSSVNVGDTITYTITVRHIGKAPVADASFTDDVSALLDDATWNDDVVASDGEASFSDTALDWTGTVDPGQVITVTYSVTVTAAGDRVLDNVVTTPGRCVPAEGQTVACRTQHLNGSYVFAKTSDPAPGATVSPGETVTYTVTVSQQGTVAVPGATVTDDLSQVLNVATWNDDATASSGSLVKQDDSLVWTGDLEVGQTVTITYSVTVMSDPASTSMRNVVGTDDERGTCVPAADGNPDCATEHQLTPGDPTDMGLADTGADSTTAAIVGTGLALLLSGAIAFAVGTTRRRRRQ